MSAIYTASATSTGQGRNGHAHTSDGRLDLDLAAPKSMGGTGEGTNPEQLFAALAVEMHGVDQQTADELAAAAHELCLYSNAVRGNVDVSMKTTLV